MYNDDFLPAEHDAGFRYEITEPSRLLLPNDASSGQPVAKSLVSAYEQVMGRATNVAALPAASDAPYMGFPTVMCGPGSIAQAHTTREFVPVEYVVAAVRMYPWVILELLG
jgi:acetylornithine deacetylase/succinyl-diaminopimelate desuccinylase-like protein